MKAFRTPCPLWSGDLSHHLGGTEIGPGTSGCDLVMWSTDGDTEIEILAGMYESRRRQDRRAKESSRKKG